MQKIILVRYGEIALKGLNKSYFESRLIKNIKISLGDLGKTTVSVAQSRVYIEPENAEYNFVQAIEKLKKLFGIVSISIAYKTKTDFEKIKELSLEAVKRILKDGDRKTFKVETKRGDKKFFMKSPEISSEIGAFILENTSGLTVDVNNPSFILFIEVRESTYIYNEIIPANKGMPVGTGGRCLLLLSGGIDSPVAGWMMAKRGVEISAIHFYSYPYTGERSKQKVIDIAKIIASYCLKLNLYIIPFTDIQESIKKKCDNELMTIITRRIMMKTAEKLAGRINAQALITGESFGQVASQTLKGLVATNDSVSIPVFRPLIGMDKEEVIALARKIDTYETSILPYEDCCTIFTAKHPKTKPDLKKVLYEEKKLGLEDLDKMIDKAINDMEKIIARI